MFLFQVKFINNFLCLVKKDWGTDLSPREGSWCISKQLMTSDKPCQTLQLLCSGGGSYYDLLHTDVLQHSQLAVRLTGTQPVGHWLARGSSSVDGDDSDGDDGGKEREWGTKKKKRTPRGSEVPAWRAVEEKRAGRRTGEPKQRKGFLPPPPPPPRPISSSRPTAVFVPLRTRSVLYCPLTSTKVRGHDTANSTVSREKDSVSERGDELLTQRRKGC
jgi:hypothetical protein